MGTDFSALVLGPSMSVFGEAVIWRPSVGDPVTGLTGIFGNAFVEVDPGSEAPISSQEPTLGIRLADWPGQPTPGDEVHVDERDYEVFDTQPDGEGGLLMILRAM